MISDVNDLKAYFVIHRMAFSLSYHIQGLKIRMTLQLCSRHVHM